MDSEMVPIILCGGAGVRLWPLSTPSHPKPFHAFFGGETLFQQALRRGTGTPFTLRPIVVASERHAELALAQAHGIGIAVDLLLEQEAKDSCAAALSGALAAQSRHGNCLAAILAADQEIPDAEGFRTLVASAAQAAKAGDIILFGIFPSGPRTSFGYVVPGIADKLGGLYSVRRFVEKPDIHLATALISDGALWNSGNFLFSTDAFLSEAQKLSPAILAAARRALIGSHGERDVTHLAHYGDGFSAISIDRAMIEKSGLLAMRPCDLIWSDLGTWDDVRRMAGEDGNFIRTSGPRTLVVGLEDVIVVATPDGILITSSGQAEALRTALLTADRAAVVNKR